jgi:hypothetical protein
MVIVLNIIYKLNEISIKISMTFFTETEKKNSNIQLEAQSNPEQNPRAIIISDFNLYDRTKVAKTTRHWQKTMDIRPIEQKIQK